MNFLFRYALGVVLATSAAVGAAEWGDPIRVGEGLSEAEGLQLAVDSGSNAFVVFSALGDSGTRGVYYSLSFGEFTTLQHISVVGRECRKPSLALGLLGGVQILFEGRSEENVDIYHVTNRGGPFGIPTNVTNTGEADELRPVVFSNERNEIEAVWQLEENGASDIVYSRQLKDLTIIAEGGEGPVGKLSHSSGRLHILYRKEGLLYYAVEGEGAVEVAGGIERPDGYDLLVSGVGEVPHVAYTTAEGVWHTYRKSDGSFADPHLVAPGGEKPSLAVSPDGVLYFAYLAGGDVWLSDYSDENGYGSPVRLTDTPGAETEVKLAVDQEGYFHLALIREGEIWYRSSIPAPEIGFSADPVSGEAPLLVQFRDESTGGPVRTRYWEFGDGATSNARNPVHVYEEPGVYTVTLTVTGPGGRRRLVKENLVEAVPARNHLMIPDIRVWIGQSGVKHPIYVIHEEPLQGFQLALVFRDDYIENVDISLEGTIVEPLEPELTALSISDGADGEKELVYGVIFDLQAPFDGRMLPPTIKRNVLAYLTYDVRFSAPVNAVIPFEFRNGLGDPPISNVLTVAGAQSALPMLHSGSAVAIPRPACLFLRADANFDGEINLADAIYVLGYLFGRGDVTPSCLDACDANDSGNVDIGDAIYILGFLFARGSPPAYPFPDPGIDADPDDDLGPCECP